MGTRDREHTQKYLGKNSSELDAKLYQTQDNVYTGYTPKRSICLRVLGEFIQSHQDNFLLINVLRLYLVNILSAHLIRITCTFLK